MSHQRERQVSGLPLRMSQTRTKCWKEVKKKKYCGPWGTGSGVQKPRQSAASVRKQAVTAMWR